MTEPKSVSSLPNSKTVKESLHDPNTLIVLGDLAVAHVLDNQHKYDTKWFERLFIALGALKDAVESESRTNSAIAELSLLLLQPKEASHVLSRAEIAEIEEPSEEEIEAWAWGFDLAQTTRWFVAFVVLGILGLLSFAIVTFGLESPGIIPTIISLSLGSIFLAGATFVLGVGLYQRYVVKGYISWKYKGYPDAEVKRSKKFYRKKGWYAYIIGGLFLALSVALSFLLREQLLQSIVHDYSIIRLGFLGTMALGLFLFSLGVWPIIASVVSKAESDKRIGKEKYSASPRLLLASLPIITSALSLLLNWLFD